MESILRLCSSLLLLQILFFADLHFAVAADSPEIAPTPAPESGVTHFSPPIPSPETGAPSLAPSSEPAPSPGYHSPPAPSPTDLGPTPSPTPAPEPSSPSPSPDASDINAKSQEETANSEGSSSGGGLSGGQKAGIAFGVIAAACIVGLAGVIYKKRQANIRRSQYGYAVRRELL